MKEQAEAYQKGENILTYELKEWYPQIRPLVGEFAKLSKIWPAIISIFKSITKKILKMIGKSSIHQPFIINISWKIW